MFNIGVLILRLVVGLLFMGHGSQKLFGWFGGGGMPGTKAMMQKMGLHPALFWALLAALCEFGGGLLLALGFLTPLGSLGIIASMLTAIVQVHWVNGFWNSKRGIEFPLVNLAAALALALTGPGRFSLDAAFGIAFPEPLVLIVGLILVILGVIVEQAIRSRAPVQPAQTGPQRQA